MTEILNAPLERDAFELLKKHAPNGRFMPYVEAIEALTKLRLTKKKSLKLLSMFSKAGLIEASIGHGIRLLEAGEHD